MDLQSFFLQHPIFTLEELKKRFNVKTKTLKNSIAYHVKTGHLMHIRRGLYYVIPQNVTGENYPVDMYLVASKLTEDAVIGYHSALAFHGHLHSVRNDIVFITQKKIKTPFLFQNTVFHGTSAPVALVKAEATDFGIQILDHQGLRILVTTKERTFVDILDRPSLTGSWEEIWKSLETIPFLNLDEVVKYVLLLKNSTTVAKVGYFLESHQEALSVPKKMLKYLSEHRPKEPHYIYRNSKESQKLLSKWNLVVPESFFKKTWEETNEDI